VGSTSSKAIVLTHNHLLFRSEKGKKLMVVTFYSREDETLKRFLNGNQFVNEKVPGSSFLSNETFKRMLKTIILSDFDSDNHFESRVFENWLQ